MTKTNTKIRIPMILMTAGVFLLSLSLLVYEIVLTRLLSIILSNQYVFLVVSGALLGLSFGAAFEYFRVHHVMRAGRGDRSLACWSALVAVSMCAVVFLIVLAGRADILLLLGLVAIMPFFFAGVTLAALFRRYAAKSSFLYAADLVGAALGAVLVVYLLNTWGGPSALLAAALGTALAATAFLMAERAARWRNFYITMTAITLTSLLFGVSLFYPISGEIPIGRDQGKDMFRLLNDPSIEGKIVESRWSAFGRTDLVRFEKEPDAMTLFIDGAAGTPMFRWDGRFNVNEGALAQRISRFPAWFPFLIMNESQKESVFIIGPGGGRDVLIALYAGVKRIIAAEVNPQFVEIMRDYAQYNGKLYTGLDNVQVVIAEGRNFLNQSTDSYDTIMLTLPITKGSRSYGGYALTESYLFTIESIQAYLDHLSDEGAVVVVTHSLVESMRLTLTVLAALDEQGVSVIDAMKQIYLLGHPMMPVFVLQKRPLTPEIASSLHAMLHSAGFDGQSSYIPYTAQVVVNTSLADGVVAEWRMMNQNLIDLAEGRIQPEQLIKAVSVDISPVSDDRPFFYKTELGVPRVIATLFWGAALLLACVLTIPRVFRRNNTQDQDDVSVKSLSWWIGLLFGGLGVGFMLIEIALFQKLVLFVGHPTVALSLLLFSLLVGMGIGSLISCTVRVDHLSTGLWVSAVGVTICVVVVMLLLKLTFASVPPTGYMMLIMPTLLLITMGIILGFPFPLSLRLLKRMGLENDIPWAWAVNGAASVVGAVLAIIVAMKVGYTAAMLCGALLYLAVALMVFFTQNHRRLPQGASFC